MVVYSNYSSKMLALHVSAVCHLQALGYIKRLEYIKMYNYIVVGVYGSILTMDPYSFINVYNT
jgi:hypothetical protein